LILLELTTQFDGLELGREMGTCNNCCHEMCNLRFFDDRQTFSDGSVILTMRFDAKDLTMNDSRITLLPRRLNYLGFGSDRFEPDPNPCLSERFVRAGEMGFKHHVAVSNAVQTLASPTNHTMTANRS